MGMDATDNNIKTNDLSGSIRESDTESDRKEPDSDPERCLDYFFKYDRDLQRTVRVALKDATESDPENCLNYYLSYDRAMKTMVRIPFEDEEVEERVAIKKRRRKRKKPETRRSEEFESLINLFQNLS